MASPTDTAPEAGSLEGALAGLPTLLAALEQALEDELRVIADGKPGDLLNAVERKRQAMQAVEHATASPDVQAFLFSGPQAGDAALLERLARCEFLNRAAGAAIATAQSQLQRVTALLGHTIDQPAYDQRAKVRPDSLQRDLAVC